MLEKGMVYFYFEHKLLYKHTNIYYIIFLYLEHFYKLKILIILCCKNIIFILGHYKIMNNIYYYSTQ